MARLPCSLALLLLAARDGNSIRHQHRRQPAQQQQQQLQCYFAVEIWYYSDWAGGHVITAVMGVNVTTVDQFMAELKKHDLTTGIRLSIVAGKIERFVLLELPEE